ncbi:pyridoxamine 5'-phosphate oxidase family protein [Calidifontibacter indicus]|uniref:pyridoxamine 5'-phosphate oxidase family protein n=1 Tax=Calidifontibacter indicus TaxID=419650 RepID=UPI003D702F0D
MSIPVAIADLAAAVAEFGAGYLLTASTDGKVKVVTVEPEVRDRALVITGPSRGSAANIAANPQVTVVFPPAQPRGYTLLVDGQATLDGDDCVVTPSAAVLHRPAAHEDGPPAPAFAGDKTGCGNDCRPV